MAVRQIRQSRNNCVYKIPTVFVLGRQHCRGAQAELIQSGSGYHPYAVVPPGGDVSGADRCGSITL